MSSFADNYVDRFERRINATGDLSFASKWIVRNTRSPKDPSKPYSFKDHEYQIEIVNDSARRLCGRKCSQIGFSEATIRKSLARLALLPASTLIYTMPAAKDANKFATQRFDPVIRNSPALSSILNKDVDSKELKQLGDSFLHMKGTVGQSAAISTPSEFLVHDELDFSDQVVVSNYASRLGHAPIDEFGIKGWMEKFSTPTLPGYGIDEEFQKSSQAYYAVKHDKCHKWVMPDFLRDVRVPGFDLAFVDFRREDLMNPAYKVDSAVLACPECGDPISHENLCTPEKRQWVRAYPDRRYSGYQVFPFDVPAYNPISSVIKAMDEYKSHSDWVNFKAGLPYEDSNNSFMRSILLANQTVRWVNAEPGYASDTVAGLDQGKTSWIAIGKMINGKLQVIYSERIRQDGSDFLGRRVLELLSIFGVSVMVMDAGPDYTSAFKLSAAAEAGQVYRCEYQPRATSKKRNIEVNEEEYLVKAYRTGTFNDLCDRVNRGGLLLPKHEEGDAMIDHFAAMKRITNMDENGEAVQRWVKVGANRQDHYAHAINYLTMAAEMREEGVGAQMPPVGTGFGTVKTKLDAPAAGSALLDRRPGRYSGRGSMAR